MGAEFHEQISNLLKTISPAHSVPITSHPSATTPQAAMGSCFPTVAGSQAAERPWLSNVSCHPCSPPPWLPPTTTIPIPLFPLPLASLIEQTVASRPTPRLARSEPTKRIGRDRYKRGQAKGSQWVPSLAAGSDKWPPRIQQRCPEVSLST